MTATSSMRVGFTGLGNMGFGMTRNLQKAGFALVMNDIRRESAAELLANEAVWADSPTGMMAAVAVAEEAAEISAAASVAASVAAAAVSSSVNAELAPARVPPTSPPRRD